MKKTTSFFVVTPAFNASRWMRGCLESVRLQAGHHIQLHHHVQDGGSRDGSVQILMDHASRVRGAEAQSSAHPHYSFSWASEPDKGMYDAIDRGWDRASADVDWLGHLNADEQYLPGALQAVAHAGEKHPQWGAIAGNCVWVDEQGNFICSQKPCVGWRWVGRIGIPASTCALFIRRHFYGEDAVRFDIDWKSFGDKVFCSELLDAGCRFGFLDHYMSLFTHRGEDNLGFQQISVVERERYRTEFLTPNDRRIAPLAIFASKASRLWRSVLGRKCKSYAWIDPDGSTRLRVVNNHRWNFSR